MDDDIGWVVGIFQQSREKTIARFFLERERERENGREGQRERERERERERIIKLFTELGKRKMPSEWKGIKPSTRSIDCTQAWIEWWS